MDKRYIKRGVNIGHLKSEIAINWTLDKIEAKKDRD